MNNKGKYTTIATTYIVLLVALTIISYYIGIISKERFAVSLPEPVFEFANGQWIVPVPNAYVKRYDELNIKNCVSTYTFWLDITETTTTWRNIFHVSKSLYLENNNSGNPRNLPGSVQQDLQYRRPAVFITPWFKSIHITHDLKQANNGNFEYPKEWQDISLSPKCMFCIGFEKNKVYVYYNGDLKRINEFDSDLLTADPEALLYICDRFYDNGKFSIKNFKVFNSLLSPDQCKYLYEIEKE